MGNNWIEHCKDYQSKHNCSWKEALTKAKKSYKGGKSKSSTKSKSSNKTKDARDKKRLPKEEVELDGETITIRKGGLHQSLDVPDDYTFTTKVLKSLKQVEVGDSFMFRRKKFKMTGKLKKQIVLAINLMKRYRKK